MTEAHIHHGTGFPRKAELRWARPICVLVLASMSMVGCGDTGETGGSGGTAGTGGVGGNGPELVSGSVKVFEFDADFEIVPIEGAMVCQVGVNNCVTSNKLGIATIYFPKNQEIAFTVEKEGYGPWVFGNVTDEYFPDPVKLDGGDATAPMYTHEQLAAIAERLQTPYPWKGGIVGLLRWLNPNQGVKFLPVGPTAEAVGRAFYFDASTQQYSLDLEATTSFFGLQDAPLAEGGFTEVVPGVQQFEFVGTAGDCPHASWGWPGDAPNRLRVPVLEGYITYGSVRCDEEVPEVGLARSSTLGDPSRRE